MRYPFDACITILKLYSISSYLKPNNFVENCVNHWKQSCNNAIKTAITIHSADDK